MATLYIWITDNYFIGNSSQSRTQLCLQLCATCLGYHQPHILTVYMLLSVRIYIYIYIYTYTHVGVCVNIYIYIYIYICTTWIELLNNRCTVHNSAESSCLKIQKILYQVGFLVNKTKCCGSTGGRDGLISTNCNIGGIIDWRRIVNFGFQFQTW